MEFFKLASQGEWRLRLIDQGFDDHNGALIEAVIKTGAVKDYEKLYRAYNRLLPSLRKDIIHVWEMLCLSGEEGAFDYAVNHLKMNKNTSGKWNKNPLHYAALSGAPAQVDRALALGIPFNSESQCGCNVLHYAILSHSPHQVVNVLKLEKEKNEELNFTASEGRNGLHLAALTGHDGIVHEVLNLMSQRKIDVHQPDMYGFNAYNYAVYTGNERVKKRLAALGLEQGAKQQDDFSIDSFDRQNVGTPALRNAM